MAEMTWEKPSPANIDQLKRKNRPRSRLKYIISGGIVLSAVAFLIFSGTLTGARFFITVDTLMDDPAYIGQTVRISGAVIGETIVYDAATGTIEFAIANIPETFTDLAAVLHQAANDPDARRLPIYITNQALPDLLQHEAQAILTGSLGTDGTFYATELLLKCPSRFEENLAPNLTG